MQEVKFNMERDNLDGIINYIYNEYDTGCRSEGMDEGFTIEGLDGLHVITDGANGSKAGSECNF
jgi:hypothetical protein